MSLYYEWLDSPFEPVIVAHDGKVLIGEFSDKPLTPEQAEIFADVVHYAAMRAKHLLDSHGGMKEGHSPMVP